MTLKEQKIKSQLLRNSETFILNTLIIRFKKQGIVNPEKEANRLVESLKNNNVIEFYDVYPWKNIKKYLLKQTFLH